MELKMHTNKQLKRKMEFMIGPRTPEALIRCKPGGRLQFRSTTGF
jgi:hypothetical protein